MRELNKINTALRISILEGSDIDEIASQNIKVSKIGEFLQYRDENNYELVNMTTKTIIDFKTFKEIHFTLKY